LFFHAGNLGSADNTPIGFATHAASSAAMRKRVTARPGANCFANGAVTLRAWGVYVGDDLADESESGSQPNN
jgi:hypothetical protein